MVEFNNKKTELFVIIVWQYEESIVWIYDNFTDATIILDKLIKDWKYAEISKFYLNENLYNY